MSLDQEATQWYAENINKLSTKKNQKLAYADLSDGLITYPAELRSDESSVKAFEPEELVHALIINKLASEEYSYEIDSMYHEQHFAHGSKGSLSDEVDLILYDHEGLPYAIMEFKSAEKFKSDEERAIQYQLFGTAPLVGSPKLLVYATIFPDQNATAIELKCIDYVKYKSYEGWVDDGKPYSTFFPKDYEDIDYVPYAKNTEKDLKLNTTQSDFRAVANSFHNEFFGEHPDNALFVNLVKCLLAKIFDERTTKGGLPYRFQIKYKHGKAQNSAEVFQSINDLYKEAYRRYIDKEAEVPDEIDPKEFSKEKVKSVARALESLSITKGAALHGDIIGAFFEEILRSGFKQDKGMYFTHTNLIKFIIEAIDLDGLTKKVWNEASHPDNRLPYIIDPACGSGAFLLHAMNNVTGAVRNNKDYLVSDDEEIQFYNARMNDENPNYWAENFLYGFDPKFIMAITAKVNMVLHGDGSAHMFKYDAFKPFSSYKDSKLRVCSDSERSIPPSHYSYDLCETFDAVLSNPPFGVTLASDTQKSLSKTFSLSPKLPSEALFIERAFQLLKPGGRLGVVLPESIFNAVDLMPVRMFIYRMFNIKAIVALPRNVFIDTPTLTSLLFAEKKSGEEIINWDKEWEIHQTYAATQLKKAKELLSKGELKKFNDPKDLQNQILALLAGIMETGDWVYKKGRNAEIIQLSPIAGFSSVEEAAQHYFSLFKASGFNKYIQRYAFSQVSNKFDNRHHSYMVDEVGYKLSKRKEKPKPNQLASLQSNSGEIIQNIHLCDEEYSVVYNVTTPKVVLDYIRRDMTWGS